jgi:hypothetical protein
MIFGTSISPFDPNQAVNKTHLAAVGRARQRDAAPQGIAAMLQVCQGGCPRIMGDIMGLTMVNQ